MKKIKVKDDNQKKSTKIHACVLKKHVQEENKDINFQMHGKKKNRHMPIIPPLKYKAPLLILRPTENPF